MLECPINGIDITVSPSPGSLLSALHGGADSVIERTTCNYGLEPSLRETVTGNGMDVGGIDELGEVRAVERSDHRFFVATLYQPQLASTTEQPHPIFVGLINAAST